MTSTWRAAKLKKLFWRFNHVRSIRQQTEYESHFKVYFYSFLYAEFFTYTVRKKLNSQNQPKRCLYYVSVSRKQNYFDFNFFIFWKGITKIRYSETTRKMYLWLQIFWKPRCTALLWAQNYGDLVSKLYYGIQYFVIVSYRFGV